MQEPPPELNELSEQVIGAAIEVHRHFGAGFQEITYQRALMFELEKRGIECESEVPVQLQYKGKTVGQGRIDILIANKLIVELKAGESNPQKYRRQVAAYLKATGLQLGLVINFETNVLKEGISRVVSS